MINDIGISLKGKGSITAHYAFKYRWQAKRAWEELRELARKIEFKYSRIERSKRIVIEENTWRLEMDKIKETNALLLNRQERIPIVLVEYLNKTQELQISTDGKSLQILVDKDIQWLLVISQILTKAGNQYIQEYIDQKKRKDLLMIQKPS